MGTDIHGVLQTGYEHDGKVNWHTVCEIEDDRNYYVFAALADVRNGYGFAGVYRHEPVIPISEPRGLPEDFKVDGEADHYPYGKYEGANYTWMGDHSHSWLTLDEISEWDGWDKPLAQSGVITRQAYDVWLGGCPDTWSGGVSGPGVAIGDAGYQVGKQFDDSVTYVRISWDSEFRYHCGTFLAWLEYVRTKTAGDKHVRVVFGFDS